MDEQSFRAQEALEPERSGGEKASSFTAEVPEIPKKRRFTTEFKLKILKELEDCKISGGRGLIIRREGLFSSQVSQWKKTMKTPIKKKTQSNPDKNEIAKLKRENAKLKATFLSPKINNPSEKNPAENWFFLVAEFSYHTI
jgi:transposase-like protein